MYPITWYMVRYQKVARCLDVARWPGTYMAPYTYTMPRRHQAELNFSSIKATTHKTKWIGKVIVTKHWPLLKTMHSAIRSSPCIPLVRQKIKVSCGGKMIHRNSKQWKTLYWPWVTTLVRTDACIEEFKLPFAICIITVPEEKLFEQAGGDYSTMRSMFG